LFPETHSNYLTYNLFQANGGNGYNNGHQGGGGGSGGRIAVYYKDNEDYDGIFEAYGGFGNEEYGAAGTIYHHHMTSDNITKRSLYVNNNGHAPQTERVNEVGFITIRQCTLVLLSIS
jgi:hypothetical protein